MIKKEIDNTGEVTEIIKPTVKFQVPCCCFSCDAYEREAESDEFGNYQHYYSYCGMDDGSLDVHIDIPYDVAPMCPKMYLADFYKIKKPVCTHAPDVKEEE